MLKRLWQIFGPIICALVLVVVVIFSYPQGRKHDYQAEKRSAVTLTAGSFKGRTQKVRTLTDKKHRFVPYFGSSEWLRFDSMHPAVLSENTTAITVRIFWGNGQQHLLHNILVCSSCFLN